MDIATIAELGTATGTLFLGVATFGATRSANRSARIAERALLLGLRPVLTPARPEDPDQDVIYGDGHTVRARGNRRVVEESGGIVFLAIPLRNVGARTDRTTARSAAPDRSKTTAISSATSTSPPATSVTGRRRCAIPTTICGEKWSRRSPIRNPSTSISSTATTRATR